jgi:hypothetical protein
VATIIHQQEAAVDRLGVVGLTIEIIREAVLAGELARSSCTRNDPPALAGLLGWGRTTRGLRERTIPLGWKRSEAAQLSTVVHPSGEVAIAVATGDEGTGIAAAAPRTKYPKGPATAAAVERNQLQLGLFEPDVDAVEGDEAVAQPGVVTWLLLIARIGKKMRFELSLPGRIGEDDRVEDWAERILFEPISVEPTPNLDKLDDAIDIDVPVERRAS